MEKQKNSNLVRNLLTGRKATVAETPPLEPRERKKRKREGIAIIFLALLFACLTFAEFRLSKISSTLPFVSSIFFFGLLNANLIILIALVWLVFRNIGKLFIERRRRILGSRLKTKLVIAFFAFSIIPTLVLFLISAMYINSSFDKWFSLKIQNTFDVALEITQTYYRNTDETARHFAEHLAKGVGQQFHQLKSWGGYSLTQIPEWVKNYLAAQRELLALDAVEFYVDPFDERIISQRSRGGDSADPYPRLSLDLLEKSFDGQYQSVIQHIGTGDLIRCLVPVNGPGNSIVGVLVVNSYIPVSLVHKVDEIASVSDDYKDINPFKYPMKTAYLLILIMITLVILFVAIWIGLYMAKELTIPVERLVHGAQEVGAGNLDVTIVSTGHDEISVLVDSFNKMTKDLRENRERLTQATADLEKRRLQLEAVLANVGTGVIVAGQNKEIYTFNRALSHLLDLKPETVLNQSYSQILGNEGFPLVKIMDQALSSVSASGQDTAKVAQWHFHSKDKIKVLAAVATPLREFSSSTPWGVVAVIDDLTHLIKAQRETAWREVARRIAHEIKNPLTPIKLSAQRLQRRLGNFRGRDGALLQECTDTIIRHTDEMKELVNEFSNFARFPEISPAPHDLNKAVGEVLTLFEQAHPQIQFKLDFDPKLPIFEFDRDQIKRVLINLLDNAVGAFQSATGPSLKVRIIQVESHYHDQLQIAVVIVKDNGIGMSDVVKARVFEPYFSTKTEGTGLGLAIAKRIINDHDGFIRVHSVPGEGTQFFIELPTGARPRFEISHSEVRTNLT